MWVGSLCVAPDNGDADADDDDDGDDCNLGWPLESLLLSAVFGR